MQNCHELEWSYWKMCPPRDTSEGLGSPQWAGVGVSVPYPLWNENAFESPALWPDFPRLQTPGSWRCGAVKVCLESESSPLWNGTFLSCLEKNSGYPVLETISSFVLHHQSLSTGVNVKHRLLEKGNQRMDWGSEWEWSVGTESCTGRMVHGLLKWLLWT